MKTNEKIFLAGSIIDFFTMIGNLIAEAIKKTPKKTSENIIEPIDNNESAIRDKNGRIITEIYKDE